MQTSHSCTNLHQPPKTKYHHTRNTTQVFTNTTNSPYINPPPSKIHQTYLKARNIIDQLIHQVEEKNNTTINTVATVREINERAHDVWNTNYQNYPQSGNPIQYHSNLNRQLPKNNVFQRAKNFQIAQPQLHPNGNFQRKSKQFSNQTAYLMSSQPNADHQIRLPIEKQSTPTSTSQRIPPNYLKNIFYELQNLKAENQHLRQQTIKLLQIRNY